MKFKSINFKSIYIINLIIFFPIIIIIAVAHRLAIKAIKPKKHTYDYYLTDDVKKIKFDDTRTIIDLQPELFYLKSYNGEYINCRYYNFNKDKIIIFVHGYTSNMCNYVKYIPMFEKLGYNIFMFDQRYHGESSGRVVSFGYHEKKDLKTIVNWTLNKHPKSIGLFGHSMGAATILQYLSTTDKIDFAIVDCSFSDLKEQLAKGIKETIPFISPTIILFFANIFFKLIGRFDLNDVKPIKDVEYIDIPLMFVHGDADDFVPCHMCHQLYEAKKGKKQILIIPDAKHAGAYDTNPSLFINEVTSFLKKYGL